MRHPLWHCSLVNATKPHQWEINIGSGNGLVPLGTKPLPDLMLSQICHHMASLGELMLTCIILMHYTINKTIILIILMAWCHRFSQKWQLGVCKQNFMMCKMPFFDEIPHENGRIRMILGCAINSIACAKHGCLGGWLILCLVRDCGNSTAIAIGLQQSCIQVYHADYDYNFNFGSPTLWQFTQ